MTKSAAELLFIGWFFMFVEVYCLVEKAADH